MGIKQLYNDNLRKLPNEYGDVSVMWTFATQKNNLKILIMTSWTTHFYACTLLASSDTLAASACNQTLPENLLKLKLMENFLTYAYIRYQVALEGMNFIFGRHLLCARPIAFI